MQSGAYGEKLAEAMKVKPSRSFVSARHADRTRLAVTEIRTGSWQEETTSAVAPEDALLVMTQLSDWHDRVLFEDGRRVDASDLKAGDVTLFDLRKAWNGCRRTPVHYVCFYFPRTMLVEIAELDGLQASDDFPNDYAHGNRDRAIASLTSALMPALARPDEANRLFMDHIATAIASHVIRQYGGVPRPVEAARPLSQKAFLVADEMLSEDLQGNMLISDLATECGMTITEFVNAFEISTGMKPHQWLLQRRTERAVDLLKRGKDRFSDISRRTGFATAEHLERVLRRRGFDVRSRTQSH